MKAHDRFEQLSGALALGEATADERAEFLAHAATCAACRDDAKGAPLVSARVIRARESETWRPRQPIVERIAARRSARARTTFGALGWAIAASIVLNVVVATGVGRALPNVFARPVPVQNVVAQSISRDRVHRIAALTAPVIARKARVFASPVRPVALVAKRPATRAIFVRPAAPAPAPTDALDDISTLIAGAGSTSAAASRAVAVDGIPRCLDVADGDGDAASVRPCRTASGRVLR